MVSKASWVRTRSPSDHDTSNDAGGERQPDEETTVGLGPGAGRGHVCLESVEHGVAALAVHLPELLDLAEPVVLREVGGDRHLRERGWAQRGRLLRQHELLAHRVRREHPADAQPRSERLGERPEVEDVVLAAACAACAGPLGQLVRLLENDVDRHFAFEEEQLFPRMTEGGDGGMASLLQEEHDAIREPNDWNRLHILARGGHIEVTLNGEKVVDYGYRVLHEMTVKAKALTEADIRTKFITPALVGPNGSKWNVMTQLREELFITRGRVIGRGMNVSRRLPA